MQKSIKKNTLLSLYAIDFLSLNRLTLEANDFQYAKDIISSI